MAGPEKISILFAHVDPSFSLYVGILVKRFGYDIYIARDGVEAVALAKEKKPSLIVLDQNIPKLDTGACFSMIRNDVELRDTPVLLMTSETRERSTVAGRDANYCGILNKPLNVTEFYAAVQHCHQYAEKRRFLRAPMLLKVFTACNAEKRELFATNLSVEGMFLRTMEPYDIGTELDLVFSIDEEDPLELKARVVSMKSLSTEIKSEPGLGLKFIDVPEDVRSRISYVLLRELARDLVQQGEYPDTDNYLDATVI